MKSQKREHPATLPEKTRRRDRILYGEGGALEPEDESIDAIAGRLAGVPPAPAAFSVYQNSPLVQKFLRRYSPELRQMAESKVVEADVLECAAGKPVVLDLSSGVCILDPSEPRPPNLRVGSHLLVSLIESTDPSRGSGSARPVCSARLAHGCRALSVIESIWAGGLPLECVPVEHLAGEGWIVDVDGFKAVLPEDEAEDSSAGVRLNVPVRCLILHYDVSSYCVILSRKKYLASEQAIQMKLVLRQIRPGQILDGRVASVTPLSAWVELGKVRAELSGDDAGYGSPRENLAALQAGQPIRVIVLDVAPDRIAVGCRQLTPDPWVFIKKTVQPGMKVDGTVRSIQSDHVKVELKEGYVAEIPWKEAGWQIEEPSELEQLFRPGTPIEAACLSIQREAAQIILSVKSLQSDPLPEIQRKYPAGTRCEVRFMSSQETRAKVVTDDGYFGFILPEDLAWTGPVSPRQFFSQHSASARFQVEVLSIDPASRLIRFGVKQVKPDPFILLVKEIEAGKTYEGKVVKLIAVGALVEIRKGLVGLLRKSDYADGEPAPAEGQSLQVIVLNIQREQHRIALSRRAVVELEERRDMQPFLSAPQDERKVRMKDILQGDALKRFFEKREQ